MTGIQVASEVTDEVISEESSSESDTSSSNEIDSWFNASIRRHRFKFEIDLIAFTVFIIGVVTRMWRLDQPRSIVFDELHYGKFTSMYMKRTFFFDSHPPLGKQLIALAGLIAGYDGSSQFDRIGGTYGSEMPIWALRAIPSFFGSLLIPMTYYLCLELGLSNKTSALAAFVVIFENTLLTQSRFILMESMLMFFSILGVFCLLRFRKQQVKLFSATWWIWLFLMVASLTCAVCIKYAGIFTVILATSILIWDSWKLLENRKLSNWQLITQFALQSMVCFIIPVFFYLLVFYIHLNILIKAGPHDNIMTSAFQASLEGGLASITKGQPLEIAHGSQITLRHTHGRACWLHSHPHVYPLRYPDKRGSSHQQQVTCYSFKDVNNWWIVKRPERNDLVVSEPIDKIKHGDVVQLIHGMTSRALNSHDVAAPMSPQHQEVSCYIDYNISFPAQNLWMIDIVNKETEGNIWHTIHSHIRLIHVNSMQALKFSGKQLPEWGFNQHEVVTDRESNQQDTIWNVEEHRFTKKADQKERERDMGMAEFVPLQPTRLSFLEKLYELQYKMFTVNQENVQDHLYSSEPVDWLFLTRGIAYWVSPQSNAQIHLVGNILIWYSATIGLFLYCSILIFYLLRRRRKCFDISDDIWQKFYTIGYVCLGGYALHFIPYFFTDRTLFLHHYLPALIYKFVLLAALIEHLDYILCNAFKSSLVKSIFYSAILLWMFGIIHIFHQFSVFSYGTTALSAENILNLRWKETWDFIIHRP